MPKTNTPASTPQDADLLDDLDISSESASEGRILKKQQPIAEEGSEFPISQNNLIVIQRLLNAAEENIRHIKDILLGGKSLSEEARIGISQISQSEDGEPAEGAKIIEGVFNGEGMIGPDGKNYSVPANYASKSKLVEGDILKLTITPNGTFLYKQIGPIDRSRLVGRLEKSESGSFVVNTEKKPYKVLTASVTYFKGQSGDEAVILVPKNGDSNWAAVENVVSGS